MDAEPGLPAAVAERVEAAAAIAAKAREAGGSIVVTGCGTSEHAAEGSAALLSPIGAVARQALDAAAAPQTNGLCIGISHEGGTPATVAALAAARHAGVTTALVTAAPDRPAAEEADLVLDTPLVDRSWCHTVGYASPLLAGGLIAATLNGETLDSAPLERLLAELRHRPLDASPLAGAERLVAAGAGADAITARELALKVAEGARLPTTALALENVLHGHLVGHDDRTAFVVVVTDPASPAARRAAQVVEAVRRIGSPTAALVAPGISTGADVELAVDPVAGFPLLGRLIGGAMALQRLTVALVHIRGVNPDLLRREEAAYRESAAGAEAAAQTAFRA